MDISLSNAIIAEAQQQGGLPAGDLPAAAERVLKPLLGGENVSVGETLTGDLQKLLAQVRAEQDEKKKQLANQRLSAVLGQICAMSDLTTAQQQQVSLIQVKIEELEAAIERETTTAAERKEALDKKRQLEADAQKELKAAEEAGDEKAIAEAKAKLTGVQDEIDALNDEIAAIDARAEGLKKEVEGCGKELSDLLAKLDYPALVAVLAAITVSASDMVPAADANPDDEEKEKLKIPSPLDIVRESLEKAFEDICEEISEKRMETV